MLKTLTSEEIKILNLLESKGNLPVSEISTVLNIEIKQVETIIGNFEKEDIIIKYKAIVNWEKIESPGVVALIQVNVTPVKGAGYDEVAKKISKFDEVHTCLLVSGAFDLLVEVEGPSLKDVAYFVADKLATIDGVEHTKTNFLLKRYKQAGDLFLSNNKTHRLPVAM